MSPRGAGQREGAPPSLARAFSPSPHHLTRPHQCRPASLPAATPSASWETRRMHTRGTGEWRRQRDRLHYTTTFTTHSAEDMTGTSTSLYMGTKKLTSSIGSTRKTHQVTIKFIARGTYNTRRGCMISRVKTRTLSPSPTRAWGGRRGAKQGSGGRAMYRYEEIRQGACRGPLSRGALSVGP